MIHFEHVSKSFDSGRSSKVILSDVTVTLPTDRNIGVLGKNGTGKSTLMRILAGVEPVDEGEITRSVTISPPIAFGGLLQGSLSGEANARFAANLYGLDPDDVCAFCYEFAEIGDYFYMPVKTYSSGMRARCAFAVSIAIDYDVYLVDEVLAVGDASFREKCKNFFQERSDRSKLIVVSHQINTLKTFCDMAAVLKDGKLNLYETVDDAQRVFQA